MQIAKPPVRTEIVLRLTLEDGVIAITTAHAAPVNLRTSLAYKLTRDEARQLAASLTSWAGSQS